MKERGLLLSILTLEGNIENLTGFKGFGVIDPVEGEENLLGGTVLLSNTLDATPGLDKVRIVDHTAPTHLITATRQGNPKRVPGGDVIGVGDVIGHLDLWVLHQTRESGGGYVEQCVPLFDPVEGYPVRQPRVVAALAGEWNLDNLVGAHPVTGRGVGWEVVGA